MSDPEDFPDVAFNALSETERRLIWRIRIIAATPEQFECGPAPSNICARARRIMDIVARLLGAIARMSRRRLTLGAPGGSAITWDEAALVCLFCSADEDAAIMALWAHRLGMDSVPDDIFIDVVRLGLLLDGRKKGNLRIPALMSFAPNSEPETLARRRGPCAASALGMQHDKRNVGPMK